MATFQSKDLKQRTARQLQPRMAQVRKLVLIYTGVLAVLMLVLNGLNLLLDNQIGATGGIGGMGLRSVLQTIQQALGYINAFFGPFWAAGFLYAMLRSVRGEEPQSRDLTEGFRRCGRIIGGMFFQLLVYLLLGMLALNLTSLLIGLSSLGDRLATVLLPVLESEAYLNQGLIDPALINMEDFWSAALPVLGIFLVIFLPACIYMSYHFRMATYLMMERQIGGKRAHFLSAAMLRGHKLALFRLDLSFWWYYLLAGLISMVFDLDVYLTLLGFDLPFGGLFWFFGSLVLYCGLLLALNLWKKPLVDCTYLALFDAIAHPAENNE